MVHMTGDVRWLDADEQTAWLSFLEGWVRLQDRLDRDLKADYGMTLEDYEILVFLSEAPERRMRMSDLAERLVVSPSRLTYRVDRLDEAGLVTRERCADDGRSVWAVLSEAGRQRLVDAAPVHVTAVRELLVDRFDRDEWLMLGRRFRSVADALE